MSESASDAARRLAAIVQWSDDAIVGKTLDGVITSWNRAAERMYGYTAEEAVGRSIQLIVPPEAWAEELGVLARIRAGEIVHHFETVRRAKDGRRLDVSITTSPIRDEHGTIVGASKIARDVTAQKRAERRQAFLLEVGEQLVHALDLAATARTVTRLAVPRLADWAFMYLIDDKGLLERAEMAYADPAWAELAERLKRFPLLSPPRTVRATPTIIPSIDDALLAGIARNAEHLAVLRQIAPRSVLNVPLGLGRRWLAVLSFMYSEASGRSYHDDDLHWAAELGRRAGSALERARLYQDLEDANRLKDDFLATLSHELRTPLNAILGYARMLKSGTLAVDGRQHAIQVVERNARALSELVSDVLDVSRIVSGKLRINVEPVDLANVVAAAVDAIRPAADAKGIELRQSVDAAEHQVSGDADRLQQVCWNLLSNAVKFTSRGGCVTLRLWRENSQVVLSVTDNGIGIRPEFLPYVFERFRQADSRPTRAYGGLGLGLAIVRHLVELHGGTVTAASDGEGTGSTFSVRLPLRSVAPAPMPQPTGETEPAVTARSSVRLDGVRVVAVDDERDSLALVADVLRSAGATVVTADCGASGLEAVARELPDVVVADVGMPHMDGYEFIRRLRDEELPRGRFTPAAALTGYARPDDRARALGAGFTMHIAKPVDPAELVTAVGRLSNRGQS